MAALACAAGCARCASLSSPCYCSLVQRSSHLCPAWALHPFLGILRSAHRLMRKGEEIMPKSQVVAEDAVLSPHPSDSSTRKGTRALGVRSFGLTDRGRVRKIN